MKEILIDFNKINSIEEFHDFISTELNLGSEYGRNLDALNDVISSTEGYKFTVLKGGNINLEYQEIIEEIIENL